jgi:hypothetical protein
MKFSFLFFVLFIFYFLVSEIHCLTPAQCISSANKFSVDVSINSIGSLVATNKTLCQDCFASRSSWSDSLFSNAFNNFINISFGVNSRMSTVNNNDYADIYASIACNFTTYFAFSNSPFRIPGSVIFNPVSIIANESCISTNGLMCGNLNYYDSSLLDDSSSSYLGLPFSKMQFFIIIGAGGGGVFLLILLGVCCFSSTELTPRDRSLRSVLPGHRSTRVVVTSNGSCAEGHIRATNYTCCGYLCCLFCPCFCIGLIYCCCTREKYCKRCGCALHN